MRACYIHFCARLISHNIMSSSPISVAADDKSSCLASGMQGENIRTIVYFINFQFHVLLLEHLFHL
jgi:hypothetical protein